MRILHWNDGFLPHIGGTETLVRDLCRAQMACGHVVAVAAGGLPGCAEQDCIDGIPIYRRPMPDVHLAQNPGLMGRLVQACAEVKRTFRPDIVHVHGSGMSSWFHVLTRQAWPCPAVVTLHAPVRLPEAVRRRVLMEADAVTTVSDSMRVELGDICAGRKKPVQVVHNGMAWPELPPAPLCFRPATMLCLGRVVVEKGFDVALRALAKIPDARLIVAGDGKDRESLENLAAELNLSDRVEFRGWVFPDEVPALINEAAVVLMPSRWSEPFGLVAVQAAQMGRPIVASAVGGIPEIVEDGVTGFLVPPDDPDSIVAALNILLQDPAAASAMGVRAMERARSRFSIARCAADYETIYLHLREGWT